MKWAHLPMHCRLAKYSKQIGRKNPQIYHWLHLWLANFEKRETLPTTLLEYKSSCSGSELIKWYITAIGMTSACLFSKYNCWSKALKHASYSTAWDINYFLVLNFGPVTPDGRTDRRTDRKRGIWAHRAEAQVCSKTCKTRPRGVWHLDQWYPPRSYVAPKGLHHGLKFWVLVGPSVSTWYAPSPQLLYPPRPHI